MRCSVRTALSCTHRKKQKMLHQCTLAPFDVETVDDDILECHHYRFGCRSGSVADAFTSSGRKKASRKVASDDSSVLFKEKINRGLCHRKRCKNYHWSLANFVFHDD